MTTPCAPTGVALGAYVVGLTGQYETNSARAKRRAPGQLTRPFSSWCLRLGGVPSGRTSCDPDMGRLS